MQKEIRKWWEQAQEDLKVAEDNLEKHHYVTALFSQQAVEKALKALFISKFKQAVPKIHDLTSLCGKIKTPERLKTIAEKLTPTYVFSRYPEAAEKIPAKFYTLDQSKEFLRLAKEALAWIKKELKF